jgi:hypothetical protein
VRVAYRRVGQYCRDEEDETFPDCDPCWEADRRGLVIVPGPTTVTVRCDECLELMSPREIGRNGDGQNGTCPEQVGPSGCWELAWLIQKRCASGGCG